MKKKFISLVNFKRNVSYFKNLMFSCNNMFRCEKHISYLNRIHIPQLTLHTTLRRDAASPKKYDLIQDKEYNINKVLCFLGFFFPFLHFQL